jgi:hypothetical protein
MFMACANFFSSASLMQAGRAFRFTRTVRGFGVAVPYPFRKHSGAAAPLPQPELPGLIFLVLLVVAR